MEGEIVPFQQDKYIIVIISNEVNYNNLIWGWQNIMQILISLSIKYTTSYDVYWCFYLIKEIPAKTAKINYRKITYFSDYE